MFKILVPKIEFSDQISKLKCNENNSGFKYRFKFENAGKRDIIDVQILIRLRIEGLRKENPRNWEVVYTPTSTLHYENIAIIRPVSSARLRPILEIKT